MKSSLPFCIKTIKEKGQNIQAELKELFTLLNDHKDNVDTFKYDDIALMERIADRIEENHTTMKAFIMKAYDIVEETQ